MIRSFFKPAGTNPEIEGPYYELSSFSKIDGHFNFEALTLGFKKGSSITKMTFCPIDPTKPIVLMVDDITSVGFVYIDHHLEYNAEAGMRNYNSHKTDEFLIDCQRPSLTDDGCEYWSVKTRGMTFVYGDVNFPNTWHLRDGDPLCAFVAGELTANQLRMHSYLSDREEVKEERREDHIRRLNQELNNAKVNLSVVEATNSRYKELINKLESTMNGIFPFVGKAKVMKIIENNK